MQIGTSVPLPAYTYDPAVIAKKAEDLGFDSIWYAEHPAVPVESDSPFPATGGEIPWTYSHFTDPYIALARASAVTRKIKLATGITLLPERNPLMLAKEISVLDLHSDGRFIFGIGTGWLKEETELMGGNFARRWTQTREALDVMKGCWTQDISEYHGEFFDFPPIRSFPKPMQKPYPPILIGGMAPKVLERIVAHADGWLPNRITPQELEVKRRELDDLATVAGRDPKSIGITIYGQAIDKQLIQDLHNAGAERVVIRPNWVESDAEMCKQLECAAEVVL
jgi:probable F420-dependent oxidoreductase